MTSDAGLLFAARALRTFAYGFLSVVLALYLSGLGLTPAQVGGLFTAALLGGAATTSAVGALAGRWGRRGVLRGGAGRPSRAGDRGAAGDADTAWETEAETFYGAP